MRKNKGARVYLWCVIEVQIILWRFEIKWAQVAVGRRSCNGNNDCEERHCQTAEHRCEAVEAMSKI